MKRIVSLFIALSMLVGANAMPEGRVSKVNQPTTLKTMHPQLHEATIARMEMAKAGTLTPRPAVKKAHKATAANITIEGNNLQLDYYWGFFPYIYGGNDEYTVEAWFAYDLEVLYGTYVNDDEDLEISIYDAADTEIVLSYTTATYQKTAKGDQFTAVGTGDDGNNYTINLTFFAPEKANDTIYHTFATAIGDAYPEYGNYYIADAEDDKFVCELVFDGMIPTSPQSEINKSYTFIETVDGTDTTYVGAPYSAEIIITETPTSYIFELSYFATDTRTPDTRLRRTVFYPAELL